MPTTQPTALPTEEIAAFLACCPSREQILRYRPSAKLQRRVRELLERAKQGRITADEQWEFDQYEHAEALIQMVKARLRSR